MADNSSVQVALRIRPLVSNELSKGCKTALDVYSKLNQVQITNTDKAFTYNFVFDSDTDQEHFYNISVLPLINNLFNGYNVTILAYGQTGSGKTHSMGTAYKGDDEMGVIPRAVTDIFNYVNNNCSYDFTITVSFMELYQEILYDLLSMKPREQCAVEIREDSSKGIFIPGLTEQFVANTTDTLECLRRGSQGRATATTNMNSQSSRSHAIFTITITMQSKENGESKTAKFHLVDLAGSERSKKTGATGQTLKEGININKGLLALGNVISALGDEKGQHSYISYRDSNLTRLLKDSLGGNSITLMIACISPADYNVEETVSTLRYADRARKIKNKPVINQDPTTAEIIRLNKLVQQLRLEIAGEGGAVIDHEELTCVKTENVELKIKNRKLTDRLSSTISENTALLERVLIYQNINECFSKRMNDLKNVYDATLNNLNVSLDANDMVSIKNNLRDIKNLFVEIDKEQKKNKEEIKVHEINMVRNAKPIATIPEVEINDKQKAHTLQQIAMNYQLQDVTKILAHKEILAQKIAANTNVVDFSEMVENEAKILSLQNEKEHLLQQLKTAHFLSSGSKIGEQWRKRIQELEARLHFLKKKVQEQARLIKLKEKDEVKIRQLNNEIQNIKATKVKLIKSMRQESDNFRTWKMQREIELSKLRHQDRRRLNQISKLETIYSKQQNVLKRKVEEAAAINRRLKDALGLRKAAQHTKMNGKLERFGPWVKRELDVFVSTVEATAMLETLIEDRAMLKQQLESFKFPEDSDDCIRDDVKHLEDDIELRSAQIQEIQQKVLDSDEAIKSKIRFDNIQTMGEAKYTLKALFDLTAEIKRKEATNEFKLNELQSSHAKLTDKIRVFEEHKRYSESKHRDEISKIQAEYDEKINVELKRISNMEKSVEDKVINENTAVNQIESRDHTLERMLRENTLLKNNVIESNTLLPNGTGEQSLPTLIVTKQRTKRSSSDSLSGTILKKARDFIDVEDIMYNRFLILDSSLEDDEINSGDWRSTPLTRRLRKLKSTMQAVNVQIKRSFSSPSLVRNGMVNGDRIVKRCRHVDVKPVKKKRTKMLYALEI